MIPIDVYYNMDNFKFQIINVKYEFIWYFHVIVHKNCNCDNPFYPPNCAFTLMSLVIRAIINAKFLMKHLRIENIKSKPSKMSSKLFFSIKYFPFTLT